MFFGRIVALTTGCSNYFIVMMPSCDMLTPTGKSWIYSPGSALLDVCCCFGVSALDAVTQSKPWSVPNVVNEDRASLISRHATFGSYLRSGKAGEACVFSVGVIRDPRTLTSAE